MELLSLCRVLEVSLVELSLRTEDIAAFLEEADSVSILWCCVWLWGAEEGTDAAVGLSCRGAGGSGRGAIRQRHPWLEL